MNKERFIALVKNPALLKAEDASFLEELLKEFPYFQTAHLLAARCYKVSDSIHLQKQIKSAAAHITDRKVLYNLIENFQATEAVVETSTIEIPVKESNLSPEIVSDLKVQETKSTKANEPILGAKQTEEILPDEIAIPEVNIEAITLSTKAENEDQQVNHSATATLENNHLATKAPVREAEGPIEKLTITHTNIEAEIPLEKEIKIALAETIYLQDFEQNLQDNAPVLSKNEEKNHNVEVIAVNSSNIQENTEPTESPTQNLAQSTDFVAWLKNLQKESDTSPLSPPSKPMKEGEKLIEAFIEKPIQRAKPIKQEFYSPVNMAKQSVSDNDFFVTETLAKIYIKQGNLTKAIKVYQNLSLKNPEKNNIFAAQIKILKEQLHNKSGK